MSKNYKKCPRCNRRTPINFAKCGTCGLNFNKFASATNAEAKSAFRMGEKERVLHTREVPSDVNRMQVFVQCLLGGWFGLHYFSLGKMWKGILQIVGFMLGLLYTFIAVRLDIRTGFLGFLLLVCGIVWASTFIIWMADTIAIIFKRFKYPVSLPYSSKGVKGE